MPIKYLGSKRKLIDPILESVGSLAPPGSTVLDLFSGTARVGYALKSAGYRVVSNDYTAYGHAIADCYVASDQEDWLKDASLLVDEFNHTAGSAGWFTQTYCEDSRFFQPKNGERVDAIRDAIESKGLPPQLKNIMLVSLMEAADRVDSTCGIQMAYLKKWAKRSFNDLCLRVPDLLPRNGAGLCEAHQADAAVAIGLGSDLVYLDPPYNQHSYLGNYHIWESLVLWDKPEVYGIARKRIDVRERKSDFNSKVRAHAAMKILIDRLGSRDAVVSFSDEGYISRSEMEEMLSGAGSLEVRTEDYKRYVGAQIGIHSPSGEKVGDVSHLRNKEFLFLRHGG